MTAGLYTDFGLSDGDKVLVPPTQGGSTPAAVSSVTVDVNDSGGNVGHCVVFGTFSVNASLSGSSGTESSTQIRLYSLNSGGSNQTTRYVVTANGTHSISENDGFFTSKDYLRMNYWTSMGILNDTSSGSGERTNFFINIAHFDSASYFSCNTMTTSTGANRNYHTSDGFSAKAYGIKFDLNTGYFRQFRAKSYFLGAL